MAKEDFCFTCYHADAASDISHMTRLERGAYWDLVLQQKKFGWLTIDQVKKFLGKDFDECWPAIKLIMIFDNEQQMFYFEWLDTSVRTSRAHAKHQSKRGQQGGRGKKKKPESNPEETPIIPNQNQKKTLKEDEDVNGSVIVLKNKKESKNESPDFKDYQLWTDDIVAGNDAEFEQLIMRETFTTEQIQPLARQYLGLIAQYPNKEPPDQHRFRIAVLEHIRAHSTSGKKNGKQPKTNLKFDELNQQ